MKSSFLTGEGWNVLGVVFGGLWIVKDLVAGGRSELPVDSMLTIAQSAQEIAAIYNAAKEQQLSSGLSDMGQTGMLLGFIFMVLRKFIDARTELKKATITQVGRD